MPYTRKQRRAITSWLSRRHDPRYSWDMYADDAPANSGLLPPFAFAQPFLHALRDTTNAAIEAHNGFGIGATPDSLCAVLAATAARLATAITGDQYRVQSGYWARIVGINGMRLQWVERTGTGQDFHAWCVAAHPHRRLAMLDPQSVFWEDDSRPLWSWESELNLVGWRAHSVTTAKVVALANDNSHIVDLLYDSTLEELRQRDLLTPPLSLSLQRAVNE